MHRRDVLVAGFGVVATALAGCAGGDTGEGPEIRGEVLRLTTTTSTYDTGLLDAINAAFEDRFGVVVAALAQGTGAALETGRNGDADVVLVHARTLEDEFLREGYGINRRDLMFNDFVVVGPEDDPAGIGGSNEVVAAFAAIAETESVFISRGDNSGTHAKERDIWHVSDVEPGGEWYREVGDGMGPVLNQVTQTPGYTLVDRGTFLSMRSELELEILVDGPIEGGPELLANPYGIVAVNPAVHEHVNYDLAMSYIGFLTSLEGRELIETYTVDGEQLFFPRAVAEEPNFQQYVPDGWTPDEAEPEP